MRQNDIDIRIEQIVENERKVLEKFKSDKFRKGQKSDKIKDMVSQIEK
jgi:hypothetical protein